MRVLALDTTNRAGSVALVDDDRIVEEREGDPSRTHGERLPAELAALGAPWPTIDLYAVASGPGSFTGLRIGIATMQGLALVNRTRIVGVSALEALAQRAAERADPGTLVASWIDAQRGEVFSALYRVGDAPMFTPERLIALETPAVASPAATLHAWSAYDVRASIFSGDGAARYASAIGAGDRGPRIAPPVLLAGAIGRMAAISASRGVTSSPAGIHPLYVRRPDAELAREQARSR